MKHLILFTFFALSVSISAQRIGQTVKIGGEAYRLHGITPVQDSAGNTTTLARIKSAASMM